MSLKHYLQAKKQGKPKNIRSRLKLANQSKSQKLLMAAVVLTVAGIGSYLLLRGHAAPADIPTFKIRARVTSVQGAPPSGKSFQFSFGRAYSGGELSNVVNTSGNSWSDWMVVGVDQINALYSYYPVPPMYGYLSVSGVADPTQVEAEVVFDENGATVPLSAEMYDKYLGLLVQRNGAGAPEAKTMAGYNQRYLGMLQSAAIPEADRPKQFKIADAPLGDNNKQTWRDLIPALSGVGMNLPHFSGIMPKADLLSQLGINQIGGFTQGLHGSVLNFGPRNGGSADDSKATLDAWAQQNVAYYTQYGYTTQQIKHINTRDEGVYQYPDVIEYLKADPTSLGRFRTYLQSQGLSSQDVGSTSWDQVLPVGREVQSGTLPQRKLFYWTSRFMAWEASQYLGKETTALQKILPSNPNIFHNTHVWTARLYTPGPSLGWWDGDWPNSGNGMWDWFEHSRMHGNTTLWTADWFNDSYAPFWSYNASRLNDAANKGGLNFGGYVVGRKAGDAPDGMLKKAMSLVGHGAKEIFYYAFGPQYLFPGDAYSDNALANPDIMKNIGQANQLIGRSEDLLYPGKTAGSQVAILYPRSSFMWDKFVTGQIDSLILAQSWGMSYDLDYAADIQGLFKALQNSAIQPEFIEEDDLAAASLAKYKVIYVTEPNIPAEQQQALNQWTQNGGTLVKVSGAGGADRYNEPTNILSSLGGVEESPRQRYSTGSRTSKPIVGQVTDTAGKQANAIEVRGDITKTAGTVEASFDDGKPAIINTAVGQGRLVHFAFMPGYSYFYSSDLNRISGYSALTAAPIPTDYSDTLRQWLINPIQQAGIKPPVEVSTPYTEAPVLTSAAGSTITLLNWTNTAAGNVNVRFRPTHGVARVNSAKQGNLPFTQTADGITFSVNLDAADVIRVYADGTTPPPPSPTPPPPSPTPPTPPPPTPTPPPPPTSDTTPPTAPSSLLATATSPTTVNLSWTASTDNVGVTKYQIQRGGIVIAEVTAPTTTYSDTTAIPNTAYTYQVYAVDAANNTSTASNTANVTTPNTADTTNPSTPANLTATVASSSQVNLSWTPSTDNVAVAGYKVSRGGTVIATLSCSANQCSGNPITFGDSGLSPSTNYSYTVSAYDAAGNLSSPSNTAAVTTASSNTPPPATSLSIAKTTTAPTIDGNLSEYANAPSVQFGPPTNNTVTTKALWDNTNLYLAYDVKDSSLNAAATTHDGAVYDDDAVEWFIDTTAAGGSGMHAKDFQGIVNLNNAQYDARGSADGSPDASWNGLWTSAVTRNATGYSVEIKVPWTSLGLTSPPADSSLIGLDFANDDKDASSFTSVMWPNTTTSFQNASSWPKATLAASGTAPPPPPPTPTPPPTPKPGDINNDGNINIFDLSILLSRWNSADSSADLNHNGTVDIFDLSILLSKWGG